MGEVPDTVDDAVDALGGSPSADDVYFATIEFPAREIASAALALALSGGGGGGGGGGGDVIITDGTHTVNPVTTISVSGGTVSDAGSGTANLVIAGGNIYQLFAQPGNLVPGAGVSRMLFPAAATIVSVVLACGTAPGGQSILVDVNKNGTTIFTTQANRPVIATSAHATASAATPAVTAFASGDYLTIDIDQVGTSPAGADLTIGVLYYF